MSSAASATLDHVQGRLICSIAGVAAIACCAVLVGTAVAVLAQGLQANTSRGGVGRLVNNWLALLFRLHFGVDAITTEMLRGIRLTDMVIMGLTAISSVGLWFVLKGTSIVWSGVGMVLPVVGILVYVLTRLAGRSAVMAAVLAFSLIALWSPRLGRVVPTIGIAAAALLLLGDFTEPLHSRAIAMLIAAGYVLLAVWFVLIGIRMVQIK